MDTSNRDAPVGTAPGDFIREIIVADRAAGKHGGRVHTRFPPEPNGYLHIGHAKAICLNFGVAQEFAGKCNLRLDDTNPTKEDIEYVESIEQDVAWLGFHWARRRRSTRRTTSSRCTTTPSSSFTMGKAYVDDLTADEIREYRGTLTEPGTRQPVPQPAGRGEPRSVPPHAGGRVPRRLAACCARRSTWRRRTSTCATRRCTGSGTRATTAPATRGASTRCTTTRTRSRTRSRASRTRSARWSSRITGRSTTGSSSRCRRRSRPQQIEFARLNLTYTVMSKRKLLQLVQEKHVAGWDDPRMPTISGLRRRGYTPEAIRDFCERIGVAKKENVDRRRAARGLRARGPQQARAARDGRAASR